MTGDAYGCTAVSVLGGRTTGNLAFHGTATLPTFPCPPPPPAGTGPCSGSFAGDWVGQVAGAKSGQPFEASWFTDSGAGIGAGFQYWEVQCLAGVETVSGTATGSGAASVGPGRIKGQWQVPGEPLPRDVVGASLTFSFTWTRVVGGAVLTLNPMSLSLDVAGLGPQVVLTGPQTGTATFVVTSADNATVPTCGTPLTNVRGEIAGTVPLAS